MCICVYMYCVIGTFTGSRQLEEQESLVHEGEKRCATCTSRIVSWSREEGKKEEKRKKKEALQQYANCFDWKVPRSAVDSRPWNSRNERGSPVSPGGLRGMLPDKIKATRERAIGGMAVAQNSEVRVVYLYDSVVITSRWPRDFSEQMDALSISPAILSIR